MAAGSLKEMLADAAKLEVTSMLVDGISGRKFPSIPSAYLETLSAWVYQFVTLTENLEKDFVKPGAVHDIVTAAMNWKNEKKQLFETYGHDAEEKFPELAEKPLVKALLKTDDMDNWRQDISGKLGKKPKSGYYGNDMLRLLRIQTRLSLLCSRLAKFYRSDEFLDNKKELAPDRLVRELRKLWELKQGFIFAQNTVQLDGDIINRYNARLFREKPPQIEIPQLLEFHHRNVDIGMKQWHFLIETIVQVAKALGGKLASLVW